MRPHREQTNLPTGVSTIVDHDSPDPLDSPTLSRTLPTARARQLERTRILAHILDNAVEIPGTNFRIGLDAVIGLIPGVGDVLGMVVSGYILYESVRLGASKSTLLRMVYNVVLEVLLGAIPGLGDIFDAAWKANARNANLLLQHLEQPDAALAASRRFAITVFAGFVLIAVGAMLVAALGLAALL
jgi:hypothetical protein